ncbi:MAG: pilin [Candidatus Pacearchaeota archaeon]
MKKFLVFFILVFYFLIFFISSYKVRAQNIGSQLGQLASSSAKCEIGDKCCSIQSFYINISSINLPFPFDEIIKFALSAVNAFLDLTINKASDHIKNFFKSLLGMQQDTYCQIGKPSSDNPNNCFCQGDNQVLSNFCLNIKKEGEKQECLRCIGGGQGGNEIKGVWTAIGCIYGDLGKFIKEKVFSWGIGLAGIVALLCIIYAAFTLQTSQGNPEKIKKAQELITSCIIGLMLIIFSVFILRLIGVDILKIPTFN